MNWNNKTKIWTISIVIIVVIIVVFFISLKGSVQAPSQNFTDSSTTTLASSPTSTATTSQNIISEIVEKISDAIGGSPTSPVLPATRGSLPRGVFSLISPNQDFNVSLNNPNVTGLAIGEKWPDLEASAGKYDWSKLDQQVSSANSQGKYVLLRLIAGGENTPAWAMTGVSKFSFVDPNEYHGGTFGTTVTIPVFWDPIFLAAKKKLIADAGAHFANSKIDIVSASCANATTNDWNTVSKDQTEVDEWNSLGFTTDKLINACEQIVDATASAFPNSLISMSVASANLLDPSPNFISKAVISYGSNKYPGRFISESNGLSANSTDPTLSGKPAISPGTLQDGHYVASQMLWFVTGDTTCRMNAQKTPCDKRTVMAKSLNTGIDLGKLYIEVYAKDIANPNFQDILKDANQRLL